MISQTPPNTNCILNNPKVQFFLLYSTSCNDFPFPLHQKHSCNCQKQKSYLKQENPKYLHSNLCKVWKTLFKLNKREAIIKTWWHFLYEQTLTAWLHSFSSSCILSDWSHCCPKLQYWTLPNKPEECIKSWRQHYTIYSLLSYKGNCMSLDKVPTSHRVHGSHNLRLTTIHGI